MNLNYEIRIDFLYLIPPIQKPLYWLKCYHIILCIQKPVLESEIVGTYKLSKHCYTEISGLVLMQIIDHASTNFSLSCSVVLTAFATAFPAAVVFMNLPCGAWYQFSKFMITMQTTPQMFCKLLVLCSQPLLAHGLGQAYKCVIWSSICAT